MIVFLAAEEIIKDVDSPNVKLLMDFYHMQRICGNLTRNVEKLMPLTGNEPPPTIPLKIYFACYELGSVLTTAYVV